MIDTNILLDWLLDRNSERTEQVDRLVRRSSELQVADAAIIEMVYALESLYRFPRTTITSNVRKVLNEPVFNCNRMMFGAAVNYYNEHPALSFVDCCLLHYAQLQNALPLWTFDKKLVNQSTGVAKIPA